MVVSDDAALAQRMRLLRSHGMTALTWDRHRGHAHSYDVVLRGFNCRMDELHAAIGLVQLARLPEANEARRRIVARYRDAIDGAFGVVVPFGLADVGGIAAHHLAVVVLPIGIDRRSIQEALRARGIQTSVHYPPIHKFSQYQAIHQRPLPRTEDVAERILTIPLFAHMQTEQVDSVIENLLAVVAREAGHRAEASRDA